MTIKKRRSVYDQSDKKKTIEGQYQYGDGEPVWSQFVQSSSFHQKTFLKLNWKQMVEVFLDSEFIIMSDFR